MKTWVVTGPIGSGKSTVSALLAQRGAAVVDADLLGHEILNQPLIREKLSREFGSWCVKNDRVDRQKLGALVFSSAQARDRLNALIHPPLLDLIALRLGELVKEGKHELAVLEAAVYFLWSPLDIVDMVVAVVADEEVRLRRLMKSRDLSIRQAKDRIQAQENLACLWDTAEVVIDNSFSREALGKLVDQLLLDHKL